MRTLECLPVCLVLLTRSAPWSVQVTAVLGQLTHPGHYQSLTLYPCP